MDGWRASRSSGSRARGVRRVLYALGLQLAGAVHEVERVEQSRGVQRQHGWPAILSVAYTKGTDTARKIPLFRFSGTLNHQHAGGAIHAIGGQRLGQAAAASARAMHTGSVSDGLTISQLDLAQEGVALAGGEYFRAPPVVCRCIPGRGGGLTGRSTPCRPVGPGRLRSGPGRHRSPRRPESPVAALHQRARTIGAVFPGPAERLLAWIRSSSPPS
jgi:hypothetical protein